MTDAPSRMLRLLSLLQTRRDWSGQVLAERLAVSSRTVRRDVDRLRELGYRIRAIKGPDGGYRLDAGSELPPLLFDDDQAVALAVALRMASASGAEVEETAARALATVRQVLPSLLRHRVDGVTFTTVPTSGLSTPKVDPGVLLAVSGAVTTREVLRFDYTAVGSGYPAAGSTSDSSSGTTLGSAPGRTPSSAPDSRPGGAASADRPAPRRVEPHHVAASGGHWYLVAWDLDRADWRVFRLDRMTPRTPTGPRFSPRAVPGGDVGRFLSARFKGHSAGTSGANGASGAPGTASTNGAASTATTTCPDAWPCTGEVVLALPARDVIPYVPDGIVEELGPDRCRLVLGSWSWVALAAAVGRFDAEVTDVRPPELVEAFGLLAARFGAVSGR